MYAYKYDPETGGLLLTTSTTQSSKEPRPVYYKELDLLGFNRYWKYKKSDAYPYMWAEANKYYYRGREVAQTKGGALYAAPEIEIMDAPEPKGKYLRFVDVPAMIEKNRDLLEKLVQDTIKKIYNTYVKYRKKVDICYVAFSGGKDSVVTLDLVQRALPHGDFLVLFGDTGMEFPDTYDVVDKVKKQCEESGIKFYRSRSELSPAQTWNLIGPPAQRMRWCCSVHKTAPQILLLRQLNHNPHFKGMAIMGVRAEESLLRSKYDEINYGAKHQGQFDFCPILSWGSAELFLYIYQENLVFNETYKKGSSRAGCLVCPMEAAKNAWFKEQSYAGDPTNERSTTFFNNIIIEKTFAHELAPDDLIDFMNIGVWKSRHNGGKLTSPKILYHEERRGNDIIITIDNVKEDWKEWIKTIGEVFYPSTNRVNVVCDGNKYQIHVSVAEAKQTFTVSNIGTSQKELYFLSWFKIVLKKSAYCIACRVCEANCPNGFIHMSEGKVRIDDKCVKCKKCYKVNGGCLVSESHHLAKESKEMKGSIDEYKNMGIQYSWVMEYLSKKDDFWRDNSLGSQMISSLTRFLKNAGISEKERITPFGKLVASLGGKSPTAWALMMCNLAYSPQFMWWIKNIDFQRTYLQIEIDTKLKELSMTDNSRKNTISSFKNIFNSNPMLSNELGIGIVSVETKGRNVHFVDASRSSWKNPEAKVILYSLYKFAEACGGYYQFTLTRLLDFEVESDGMSPAQIFGLDRKTLTRLLTGLDAKYSDFITAQFTLNLDTITLNAEKTSADVLTLF